MTCHRPAITAANAFDPLLLALYRMVKTGAQLELILARRPLPPRELLWKQLEVVTGATILTAPAPFLPPLVSPTTKP